MWSMTISDTFGGNEVWDNTYDDVFGDNTLEHHGVKGQKWGVRRTPEQLGHILAKKNARHYGKYNKAVRKISAIQGNKTIAELSPKEKAKMAKAIGKAEQYLKKIGSNEEKYGEKIKKAETKQAKTEEKAAEKQAKEDAKNQKLKEKIIKDADWDAVMENRHLFSDAEINNVANRVSAEKRLKDALNSGKGLDKLADNIKKVSNVAGAGLDLYNKYKTVEGIFKEGQKENAYKEIRQLMADGKNAEVIKKSIGISDKDVELFNKRASFIKAMGGVEKEESVKDDGPKQTGETKSETVTPNVEEVLRGTVEGNGHGIRGERWGTRESANDIIDASFEEVRDPITDSSRLLQNAEKYLPMVINDVGDFEITDLKR